MSQVKIRIERDPAWWAAVAADPDVLPWLGEVTPAQVGLWAGSASVMPLAAEHGGFMFVQVAPTIVEMHSLFTPAGRGREVIRAGVQAIGFVFNQGAAMITTYEVDGNPRSRPPRGAGFVACGDWRDAPSIGRLRPFRLDIEAWKATPFWKGDSCLQ